MKTALDELTHTGNWEIDEQYMDGASLGYAEVQYVGEPVFLEAAKELAALRSRIAELEAGLEFVKEVHLAWKNIQFGRDNWDKGDEEAQERAAKLLANKVQS